MDAIPPISQPLRLGLALTFGVLAWGAGRLVGPTAAPVTFLRCPDLADGRVLRKDSLVVAPGPAPAGAVPTGAVDTIDGRLFVRAGCVDGWLAWDAAVPPTQLAVPAAGHVAVATELAHVRPQERVSLYLGELCIATGVRVLTVDGLATDDDGAGGQHVYPDPVPVTLEVPGEAAAGVQACLALGTPRARTATPTDVPMPPPDCVALGRPEPGYAAWPVAASGLVPGARYDLSTQGRALVRGARALRADGRLLPDTGAPDPAAGAVLEVPQAAAEALQRCGGLFDVTPSSAIFADLVGPDACLPHVPTGLTRAKVY